MIRNVYATLLFCCLLMLGFYIDTLTQWQRYQSLREDRRQLQAERESVQAFIQAHASKAASASTDVSSPLSGFRDLLRVIELSGLTLQGVKHITTAMETDQAADAWRFSAVGNHAQFVEFMSLLNEQAMIGWVNDYAYKANDAAESVLSASVEWRASSLAMSNTTRIVNASPWSNQTMCKDADALVYPTAEVLLMQLPLSQLRLHGFIKRAGEYAAILILPDSSMVVVRRGAVIAREHAQVMAVNAEAMLIQVHGEQLKLLMKQGN